MPDKLAPFRLGRYDCVEHIATGGMASVYRARLTTIAGFSKDYAIKKIHSHLAEQRDFLSMFVREASLAARLDHGNIARILELNQDDGIYYMVLEYVDGLTLRQILDLLVDRGQTMPWHIACFVAMEAARALHYAHTSTDDTGQPLGLVHRDVSPSNIMVSRRGQVKVLDFGIAKAFLEPSKRRSTDLKGKYAYMSPEQVRGEVLDCRSDIFSLGSVLYEALTGQALFDSDTIPRTIHNVQRAEVPPLPGIEPLLEPVIHRMLSRNPSQRYSSADEVRSILAQILMVRGRFVDETNLASFIMRLLRSGSADSPSHQNDEYAEPTTPTQKERHWSGRDVDTEEKTIPRDASADEVDSMIVTRPMFPPLALVDDNEDPEESTATGIQEMNGSSRRSLSPSLLHFEHRRGGRATPDELPAAPVSVTPPPKLQIPLQVISSSEPEYTLSPEHFSPKMETVPVAHEGQPDTWTSRHVLILVLAILSMVVAAAAVYLAVARNQTGQEPSSAGPGWSKRGKPIQARASDQDRATSAVDDTSVTHSEYHSSIHVSNGSISEESNAHPLNATPPDHQGKDRGAVDVSLNNQSTDRPGPATVSLPAAVPSRGPRRKSDVDITTQPAGAAVLCGRKKMGKSPLRIRLPDKGACDLILNRPLHRVVEKRLTRKRWGGRRLRQYLPMVPKPGRPTRRGTSVDTKCQGPAVYRIFLNGRDTGRNCPVRLRLPPGINDVAIHLSRNRRLFYKKFRVRGGETEIVEWTDTNRGEGQ